MPYVTFNKPQKYYQLTLDDILNGFDLSKLEVTKDTKDTTTYLAKDCNLRKIKEKIDFAEMHQKLLDFKATYIDLINTEDKSKLYRSFKIPKRSGGLRQIDAPLPALMEALNDLKDILERKFFFTYHTCAFAYVKGRSTIDAVKRHQANKSRWILKTDLSKFFPHTTPDFLFKMLYQVFPLSEYINIFGNALFEEVLSLCFLNGGLPQGTPTSPMLTNQMMIPIDHAISKYCHEHVPHLCYTRYADDMDISSEYSFHWTEVVASIGNILEKFEAPFSFNNEKTHYGSTSGRNWMLGVMLNKDGNITVGHENKKTLKTMLFAFGNALKDAKPWNLSDTQHLQGLISYYMMVEGDAIKEIIKKYDEKFGFSLMDGMKLIIKGEI